jgi:arylsulfatase A-like enzyme
MAKGAVVSKITSMVDLGPTISKIFGAKVPAYSDGRDLMPLLLGAADTPWRTATLTESLSRTLPGDPDYSPLQAPEFHALRSENWLYIEYLNKDVELYNLKLDPYEMNNVQASTNPVIVSQLHAQLVAMKGCSGPSCRIADAMPNGNWISPLPQATVTPTEAATPAATATPTTPVTTPTATTPSSSVQ